MRSTLVLVTVLVTATALLAQTFRGTVLGTVTDQTGAVVVRRQGVGEEHEHRFGAHYANQRRWQLLGPRIAHRQLHRDRLADRISNFRDHCGRG